MIAETPAPPYYAVIFTSMPSENTEGYEEMAMEMVSIVKNQDGFLGAESARNTVGITVSYWRDLAAIRKWKQHMEHLVAQEKGKRLWYRQYKTRICLVERDYGHGLGD